MLCNFCIFSRSLNSSCNMLEVLNCNINWNYNQDQIGSHHYNFPYLASLESFGWMPHEKDKSSWISKKRAGVLSGGLCVVNLLIKLAVHWCGKSSGLNIFKDSLWASFFVDHCVHGVKVFSVAGDIPCYVCWSFSVLPWHVIPNKWLQNVCVLQWS